MRIGFDARILTVPQCGGVVYLTRLLEYLPQVAPSIELFLFLPKDPLPEHERHLRYKGVVPVVIPGGIKDAGHWPAKYMPGLLKEHRIDIFHQPFNADGPFFIAPCPVVVSILDLIPWVVGGIFRKPFKAFRYKIRNILWAHAAARVLTISEASKRDIVRLCRVPDGKVVVTHLGADDIHDGVITPAEKDGILRRFGLEGKKYIINMGGFNQVRRNPDFILGGFSEYLRRGGEDFYLVVTGSVLEQDGFFDRIQAKMAEEKISDRVIITGFLSTKELKVILSGAMLSVITSLYEGFCLPLTESFACGVPAVANDRGSIPEIAGMPRSLLIPRRRRPLPDICSG